MSFKHFIHRHQQSQQLVFQVRMGVCDRHKMKDNLKKIKALPFATVGTITVDSYTRVNELQSISAILMKGEPLNGYPVCSYSQQDTLEMLDGLIDHEFYIQVRHGSALPQHIFQTSLNCGLYIGEGGPVSYCLPYSRTPLDASIKAWQDSCLMFADNEIAQQSGHMESFGGCMLGQLSHPSLLVAIALIECLFFKQYGLKSVSMSYAQGYNSDQDIGALLAMKRLGKRFLADIDHHIVLYTFMGMFPKTAVGARHLIRESVKVAKAAAVERIILKTVAEAFQIPDISDNLDSLRMASETFDNSEVECHNPQVLAHADKIHDEALAIIERTLDLNKDIGKALKLMFKKGFIDVPYCIHNDNQNKARTALADNGEVIWSDMGNMNYINKAGKSSHLSSNAFLQMLTFNQRKYDSYLSVRS